MSAAPAALPDCRCGHSQIQHESLAPQCSAPRCECLRYQPAGRVLDIRSTVPPAQQTIEQTLAAAARSPFKRTTALAKRIAAEIEDLRDRLAGEARSAQTLAEIARLEKQLAAAKARLKGAQSTGQPAAGTVDCPDCGRTFTGAHGLAVHQARTHRDTA
jgi:uncharacterized membrane protein YccC